MSLCADLGVGGQYAFLRVAVPVDYVRIPTGKQDVSVRTVLGRFWRMSSIACNSV